MTDVTPDTQTSAVMGSAVMGLTIMGVILPGTGTLKQENEGDTIWTVRAPATTTWTPR